MKNYMYVEGEGELTLSALVQKASCAAESPGCVMAARAVATMGPIAAQQNTETHISSNT